MSNVHVPLPGPRIAWLAAVLVLVPAGASAQSSPPPIRIVPEDEPPPPGSGFDRLFPALPSDFLWQFMSTEGPAVDPALSMRYLPYPSPGPPGPSGPDGTWSMLEPPSHYGAAGIYDPLRDRLLVIGGAPPYADGRIDVWSLSLDGVPRWERVAVAGTPPPGRTHHTAVYDALRDRVVVFGGNTRYGAYWTVLADAWVLDLGPQPAWSPLLPAGPSPPARTASSAVYDPVRDRMLIYGGRNHASSMSDVWQLEFAAGPAWSPLAPAGPGPGARNGAGMIYDSARDRVVVVGGFVEYSSGKSDVWALSLGPAPAWSLLAPGGGPSGHYDQQVLLDPDADRLVAFVGYTFPYEFGGKADLWTFALGAAPAWSHAIADSAPAQRYGEAVALDSRRRRLLMCWGWDSNSTGYGGDAWTDAWAWSLAQGAWEEISPAGKLPPQRLGHTATHDPVRDRMIVIGGFAAGLWRNSAIPAGDTWALSLQEPNRWTSIGTATALPGRAQHSAIHDAARDRIVVFGGVAYLPNTYTSVYLDDAWSLSLSGPAEWTRIVATGGGPGPRAGHSAVYDPVGDRMIVYGGRDADYTSRFDDVWSLSFSGSPAWTRLTPGGDRPAGRLGHSAIHDPAGNRMLVFGGQTALSAAFGTNEVFALRLNGIPSWQSVATSGPLGLPAGRLWHGAAYDGLRRRLIVMGGLGESWNYTRLNDVWQLSLQGPAEWMPLDTGGSGPRYRSMFGLIHDPVADRLVQSGGNLNVPLFFDTWFLDLSAPAPGGDELAGATVADEMQGSGASPLTLRAEAGPARANVLRVSGGLGPAAGGSLAVHDLRGRRLLTRDLSPGPDGTFAVDVAHALPSGIYFLVLAAGGRSATTRTVVLR